MDKENIQTHGIIYSVIKKNKINFAGKWIELQIIVKKIKSDTERQISHFFLHAVLMFITV